METTIDATGTDTASLYSAGMDLNGNSTLMQAVQEVMAQAQQFAQAGRCDTSPIDVSKKCLIRDTAICACVIMAWAELSLQCWANMSKRLIYLEQAVMAEPSTMRLIG